MEGWYNLIGNNRLNFLPMESPKESTHACKLPYMHEIRRMRLRSRGVYQVVFT